MNNPSLPLCRFRGIQSTPSRPTDTSSGYKSEQKQTQICRNQGFSTHKRERRGPPWSGRIWNESSPTRGNSSPPGRGVLWLCTNTFGSWCSISVPSHPRRTLHPYRSPTNRSPLEKGMYSTVLHLG